MVAISPDSAEALAAMWDAVGGEVLIFVVTLMCALVVRAASRRHAGSKAKEAPALPPSAVTSLEEPRKRAPAPAVAANASLSRTATPLPGVAGESRRMPGASTSSRAAGGLLDQIVVGIRDQGSFRAAGLALQRYSDELRPMLRADRRGVEEAARHARHTLLELYSTLVHCAIRLGRHHLVEAFIGEMVELGVGRSLAFYESAMKQLAGQKQYHLALSVYDRLAEDGLQPSAVTCSCLISFATEVGEYERAVEFFESLCKLATPSIRAYMSVLRVHAKRQDFASAVAVLRDMDRRQVGVDALALNVVLATGVSLDQLDAVEQLVAEASAKKPPICDVVSYNTLLKGYAQRGRADAALKAIEQMHSLGLAPNAITFHTAMDAAVRAGRNADAWGLFADFQSAGLVPDKFTCSIMVKTLSVGATEAQVSSMLELLAAVEPNGCATLKTTLYHSTFEAAVAAHGGGAELPAKVFAQMRRHKVKPTAAMQRAMVQLLPTGAAAAIR